MRKKTTAFRFESVIRNSDGSISIRKGGTSPQNGSSNGKVLAKKKKRSVALISPNLTISENQLVLDLPLQTVSEANCFESWMKKSRRHKNQQRIVANFLKPHKEKIRLPCEILLIRFAPKQLDKFDNLPMSFKYIVDAICAIITGEFRPGLADSDDRISIKCDQVKSDKYGIQIIINF